MIRNLVTHVNNMYKRKLMVSEETQQTPVIIILKIISFNLVPDSLVLPLLKERLGQLDCVSKGWIIHGFPKNREQAEALERSGHVPNR